MASQLRSVPRRYNPTFNSSHYLAVPSPAPTSHPHVPVPDGPFCSASESVVPTVPPAGSGAAPSSASFSRCSRPFRALRLLRSANLNGVPLCSCSAAMSSKVLPAEAASLRISRVRSSQMMWEAKMPSSRKQLWWMGEPAGWYQRGSMALIL